jgi:hypothetical protein
MTNEEPDTLMAARVMGWHKGKGGAIAGPGTDYELPSYWYDATGVPQAPCVIDRFAGLRPWSPTTDIASAGQVADRLYTQGLNVTVTADHGWRAHWECCVLRPGDDRLFCKDADTAPLAICRAALAAVEGEEG